jgi:hypothetical protein
MPTAKIDGEERSYCADCYWKVEKQYKAKQSCEDCSYFAVDKCKKRGEKLEPVTVGYNTYFVQAEGCGDFSNDKDVVVAEIKKLEAQGKYEEAAAGYDRWGMREEANAAMSKARRPTVETVASVKTLMKTGQTVTYYCPHCGAQLKVGAKAPQVQKFCTRCKGDLSVIDLNKLIEQHAA